MLVDNDDHDHHAGDADGDVDDDDLDDGAGDDLEDGLLARQVEENTEGEVEVVRVAETSL